MFAVLRLMLYAGLPATEFRELLATRLTELRDPMLQVHALLTPWLPGLLPQIAPELRDSLVSLLLDVLRAGHPARADLRAWLQTDAAGPLSMTLRSRLAEADLLALDLDGAERHLQGLQGPLVTTLAATRAHFAQHPRDAMVAAPATGVFGLIGFSGRQGREPEQIEFLEALKPHLADDWWFQGVYAFALEEYGRLDEALDLIERSMATNPKNAHGAHIKAHVLYEQGKDRIALDYLDAWLPTYAREGLMHCHIS